VNLSNPSENLKHLDVSLLVHHDVIMRTTLTLEPDVARLIDEEVHRSRKSFKAVVNDGLRRGLAGVSRSSSHEFRVEPHHATLQPGLDPAGFNRLADELEDERARGKGSR
jgi:hypothetical protein